MKYMLMFAWLAFNPGEVVYGEQYACHCKVSILRSASVE